MVLSLFRRSSTRVSDDSIWVLQGVSVALMSGGFPAVVAQWVSLKGLYVGFGRFVKGVKGLEACSVVRSQSQASPA